MNTYFIVGFRPLSRYIGLYHEVIVKEVKEKKQRFRPLSRYIGLYHEMDVDDETKLEFPSPLEVYRFISKVATRYHIATITVSVPSRGI